MRIITLDNLKQILNSMTKVFGSKPMATRHRSAIKTYLVDIDYSIFTDGADTASSARLGVGRLGFMILGKNS